MISNEFKLRLQFYIYLMTLDGYSPHGVLGGREIGDWQFAVNLIYRCLRSGVWEIYNSQWLESYGVESYFDFCKKLSELNPFSLSEEGESFWLEPLIYGTDLSRSLVDRFEISGSCEEVCSPFFCEVEELFSVSGVSLSMGDIFIVGGSG